MAVPKAPTCPVCQRATAPREKNASFPFCSDRCKVIDLGKWLGGEYRVPATEEDEGDSASPGADDPGPRLH